MRVLSAIVALSAAGAASAQQPAVVYDQNNSFGLSNAGVQPGPYVRLGGGESWSTTSRFGDTPFAGGGVGIRLAPWFRTEADFDWRFDNRDYAAAARLRNWAATLNGFVDFNVPFLRPLIPYVGAGAGIDQNKVGSSTVTQSGTTVAHLTGSSRNQFAWQAMAGLSWYMAPNLALDVGYRFFYGGRVTSGATTGLPVRGDYSAHEIVGSLRWGF
jgi:opacity protein-like surface antigen